jgi:sugar (pentulose or hexulose) kinase
MAHTLGIDLGTQGLSVLLLNGAGKVVASASAPLSFLPNLPSENYEQQPADWLSALRSASASLSIPPTTVISAVGIVGQMHGEVLCDESGAPVGPARLWCDARNAAEGEQLTALFGVKVPTRLTAARYLYTLRTAPEKAEAAARLTTPAGFLAYHLTGAWVLGVGDAAGVFPIDCATGDFDARCLALFDGAAASVRAAQGRPPPPRALRALLPRVAAAGGDGGVLSAAGAALLGLPAGTPVAPAEGDQPAALAGCLVAAPGEVAMCFGTSVVANAVQGAAERGGACRGSRAVDVFCAADGAPTTMVWLRNGTTPLNAAVRLFGGDFDAVVAELLAAPPDCGGLLALPFLDGEPGAGAPGASAALHGVSERNFTRGCVARALLLAVIFNLRLGGAALPPPRAIALCGGLAKTPALGQLVADAFAAPVRVLDGAEEGSAKGAALLAGFRAAALRGEAGTWAAFIAAQPVGAVASFSPTAEGVAAMEAVFTRYSALLAQHRFYV